MYANGSSKGKSNDSNANKAPLKSKASVKSSKASNGGKGKLKRQGASFYGHNPATGKAQPNKSRSPTQSDLSAMSDDDM